MIPYVAHHQAQTDAAPSNIKPPHPRPEKDAKAMKPAKQPRPKAASPR